MPNNPPNEDSATTPVLVAVGDAPVVVRRDIKWGDADPAGVVYTPMFLHYMVEAAEVWFKRITGLHWSAFGRRHGISMPAVACDLDFHLTVRPDDRLDITITVERVGRSSHTLAAVGRDGDGRHVFDGRITFATVDPAAEKSLPMPKVLAERLEAYRKACAAP